MLFLKNHKIPILLFLSFILVYFVLRIYNILSLPIFTDEAIYLRWAQIARFDANWRFISLTDGKQPMFVWLTMIVMKFISDPLLSGRLVSVFAGLFSLIGIFFLAREIFKNLWVGIIASFLYLIYPMALVYDRMALYDSLGGTFSIWSLFLAVLLVRRIRFDTALLLGMVGGAGVLTKSYNFFSIYLLPFSLLLFTWTGKNLRARFLKWMSFAILAAGLSYIYYSVLRLSPFFHIIDGKNALFVFPFKEWILHPLMFFWGNLIGEWDWLHTYLTLPIIGLIAASFFLSKNFFREKILLVTWFLIPFVILAFFGKVLYPRFIFFMTLSLIPLAAYSLFSLKNLIKNKVLFAVVIFIFSILSLYSDFFILNDFSHAPIPTSDLNQYSNDWPSGGGIRETVKFLNQEAEGGKIYVATQGTFGLLPFALEIYLVNNPNIKIEGIWPIEDKIPQKIIEESKKNPTYFVFYQPCNSCNGVGLAPSWGSINLVYQYQKYRPHRYLSVYQIKL